MRSNIWSGRAAKAWMARWYVCGTDPPLTHFIEYASIRDRKVELRTAIRRVSELPGRWVVFQLRIDRRLVAGTWRFARQKRTASVRSAN